MAPNHYVSKPTSPTNPVFRATLFGGFALPSILAALVLWFAWFSQVDDFSYHYHADEAGKIGQIQSSERNFNHPLLLLEATRMVVGNGSGSAGDKHEVVVAGRRVSLACAALAAGFLTAWMGVLRGAKLAWLVAPWFAFHPKLGVYGHFFKEDTALVMGMALTLWALAAWQKAQNEAVGKKALWWLALASVGGGLAASGKYVGFLWLALLCGGVLMGAGRGQRLQSLGLALLVSLGVFLTINFRMVSEWPAPWVALTGEVDRATGEVHDVRSISSGEFFGRLYARPLENLVPMGLVFCIWWIVARGRRKGLPGIGASEWVAAAFCILYILMLAKSDKMADRYWLPVVLPLGGLGWLLLADLYVRFLVRFRGEGGGSRKWLKPLLISMGILVVVLGSRRGFIDTAEIFKIDSRLEAISFIRDELPANAVIAYGKRVGMLDPAYPQQYQRWNLPFLPQKVQFLEDADAVFDVEELRKMGVTHLVVNEQTMKTRRARAKDKDKHADFDAGMKLLNKTERGEGVFAGVLQVYELNTEAKIPEN